MSLAEKLAALINPEPGFQDPEQDVDTTAAKVLTFDDFFGALLRLVVYLIISRD